MVMISFDRVRKLHIRETKAPVSVEPVSQAMQKLRSEAEMMNMHAVRAPRRTSTQATLDAVIEAAWRKRRRTGEKK